MHKQLPSFATILFLATILALKSAAAAQPPPLVVVTYAEAAGEPGNFGVFTYQGELLDAGQPVDDMVSLRFDFGSESPPQLLGTSVVNDVPVIAGRFTTQVPVPYQIDNGTSLLVVAVKRGSDPDFVPLGMQPLSPTPLAMYAERAGTAALALAPWQSLGTAGIAYLGGGKVGIDTAAPVGKLHLQGGAADELSLYGSGGVPMLHFRNNTNGRDWVFRHDGSNFHLQREIAAGSESMSWDVSGNVGIGESVPAARLDVATAVAATPVLRLRHTGTGATNATGATIEVAGSGFGGASATALTAYASATTGSSVGVLARSDSSDGIGSFSRASASTGSSTAVLARNDSVAGVAVDAWSAAATGTPTALRARVASVTGFAARFEGGITHVDGRLGIGTAAPSVPLQVNSAAGADALRADVNGTTKLQVHANGGVSIGGAAPPAANGLRVNGPIEQSAQTRWLSVSGKAFITERSGAYEIESFNYDGLAVAGPNGNSVYFSAPLNLPHGATITELRTLVTDLSNSEGITVQIVRRAHADSSFGVLASAVSSNAVLAQQTLVDDTIAGAVVDNQNFSYDLRALWTIPNAGNDSDIRLNTVRVAYSATAAW